MSQPRPDMQESEPKAGGSPQQLQSPRQNTPPTKSISDQEKSSSYLDILSLLNPRSEEDHHNDPASVILSTEHKPSGAIKTAEGCIRTLPRKASISKPSSRATHLQPAVSRGNIDARTLLIEPENDQAYDIKSPFWVSQLPTPPAQSHEPQDGSFSSLWPAMDTWCSSGGTTQAPAKTSLSGSETPPISTCLHNPTPKQTSPTSILYGRTEQPSQNSTSNNPGSSFERTVQQGGVMQSQGPPEGPYNTAFTQCQDSAFHSSIAGISGQTSASDPIRVLRMTTSDGSFDVPVDVHQGSRLADEKRARNAGASARFRQRRKEKETEAKSSIEKLQARTMELEGKLREVGQERDFYRADRDRLRDVVFETPGLRHHAMCGAPSPQSMQSTTLQGLMPQIVDPHVLPQTAFHATDSTSERPSKRRRKSTQGGYTSAEHFLPLTTYTSVPGGFPPRPTLPLQ